MHYMLPNSKLFHDMICNNKKFVVKSNYMILYENENYTICDDNLLHLKKMCNYMTVSHIVNALFR